MPGTVFFNIDNDLHAILRFVPAVPGKKYVTPKKTLHGHLTPGDCRCTFVGGWACRRFSLTLSRTGNSCRTGGLLRNSPPRGYVMNDGDEPGGKVNGSFLGDVCKGNSCPDAPLLTAPHKGGSAFIRMLRHGSASGWPGARACDGLGGLVAGYLHGHVPPPLEKVPPNVPPHTPGFRHTPAHVCALVRPLPQREKEKGRTFWELCGLQCGPPDRNRTCI